MPGADRPRPDDATTRRVVGAFYEVYNVLGYGFLEAVYARSLERLERGKKSARSLVAGSRTRSRGRR